MSRSAIFDTCILIDQFRSDRYRDRVPGVLGPIRLFSVVLAELARAVTTERDAKILGALTKELKLLTPTEQNWVESGEMLARMCADLGFQAGKLRDLHFDVLIALTARSNGACLITSNKIDFELIRSYRDFELEVW